ncbi:hypothetical protein KBD33_05770 [Candidatus Gracilibacteria bacterium]|nr:hypothetical protein [Candidatus Gracilibacteria bacterium]
MNSTQLQKDFPEVYRDFFSKNDLVLSGCFSFPWGSIIGERSNNILIKSKIPLKNFVGLKEKNKSGITYSNITIFDITRSDFEGHSLHELGIDVPKITSIIEEFLKENNFETGIEISGLSEISRGHSFGFAGTFFATLATGLFLFTGKINQKTLSEYDTFTHSTEFKEIFILAWRMELVAKLGNSIGQNVIHTLQNTANPSYFIAENIEGKELGNTYSEYVDIVQKYSTSIISSTIPLDYFVIFSGISTNTKMVEIVNKARSENIGKYSNFIKNEILSVEGLDKDIYIKKFTQDTKSIQKAYDDIIALSGVITLDLFIQMFTNGYDEHTIDEFIRNIDKYRYTISLIEKLTCFSEDFIFYFRNNQKNPHEKFSILPIYSGKMGGGYLVVMRPGASRATLEDTLIEMKKYYPNMEIEYSSIVDGTCGDGIQIEQFVSKGIFSPYVQADKVLFKKNTGESYLEKHSILIENETNGLVVDTITNKIYLSGVKLTSKEIPSQNATADILNILFDHIGEDISNGELPSSSYSTNKNEMLGKIIIPLIKLIEEKLEKKLPLICKGELAHFYIKLGNTQVPIGIIRKL